MSLQDEILKSSKSRFVSTMDMENYVLYTAHIYATSEK